MPYRIAVVIRALTAPQGNLGYIVSERNPSRSGQNRQSRQAWLDAKNALRCNVAIFRGNPSSSNFLPGRLLHEALLPLYS
jgi:hypothetical protein